MIWLIAAMVPALVVLVFATWREPVATLLAIVFTVLTLGWALWLVYGLYSADLIMNCGGPTFWTAEDCSYD